MHHPHPHQLRRAFLMLSAAAALFGCMAFTAKVAAHRLGGAEIAFVRFLIGSTPFLFIPRYRKLAFRYQRLDLLLYRGFFGALAVLCYFTAIEHIPVGTATLLNYSAPMFSGMFAAVLIGEPIRARVVLPFLVALIGVFLVVRSGAGRGAFLGIGIWELVGLTSAVLSGAALTAIRVARRTEGSWSIYASFTLFGIGATAPFTIHHWKTPVQSEWVALLGVGVFALVAQLLMTSAYRWVETMRAGVFSQIAVVVSMLLGAVFLDEKFSPTRLLGSALALGGVISVILLSTPTPAAAQVEPVEE